MRERKGSQLELDSCGFSSHLSVPVSSASRAVLSPKLSIQPWPGETTTGARTHLTLAIDSRVFNPHHAILLALPIHSLRAGNYPNFYILPKPDEKTHDKRTVPKQRPDTG